jgi:hypothetical protein
MWAPVDLDVVAKRIFLPRWESNSGSLTNNLVTIMIEKFRLLCNAVISFVRIISTNKT